MELGYPTALNSSASAKRILAEYRSLLSSKAFPCLVLNFENDTNINIWFIEIINYDLGPRLNRDFITYANRYSRSPSMLYEIRFPPNYPNDPPFVRIIRPRFQFRTGFVTIGGSICNHGLTKSGWNIQNTIEGILVEIMANFIEGGGGLDIAGSGRDYTLAEAEDAYRRFVRLHGW